MATQIEIQPKLALHKEWHLYVAGDGVHAARAGTFAKFIPWSEVESARADRVNGRHGQPIDIPLRNREAVLRQIRDEWHKHYPEACAADQQRARRQFLLITYVAIPVFFVLAMIFSFLDGELKRERSFGEAVRTVLITKLHWAILLGLGLSALIWVPLWFERSLREHGSRPHETRTPDNEL